MRALYMALILLFTSSPALAASVNSDFNAGDDGWQHGAYNISLTFDVEHDPAAGVIGIDNGLYAGGFMAPEKYLGNQSAFLNGSFSFQLSTDGELAGLNYPALILVGNGGETIFANWVGDPGTELTDFSILLTADSFYKGSVEERVSGVTAEEFAAVMSNLEKLSIFGNWSGGEKLRLDNVVMASATAAVPEPATWAMMIVGFGAVGANMRRRRGVSVRLQRAEA